MRCRRSLDGRNLGVSVRSESRGVFCGFGGGDGEGDKAMNVSQQAARSERVRNNAVAVKGCGLAFCLRGDADSELRRLGTYVFLSRSVLDGLGSFQS